MEVWTIQLAKAKQAEKVGIPILNTTIKCGELTFAPTWEIVLAVKAGTITQEQYTTSYTNLMRWSFKTNRDRWLEVANMPVVAVACMCKEGVFCHRHLLVKMFESVCNKSGIPFKLLGEWKPEAKH